MKHFGALAILAMSITTIAWANGPFDGKWSGESAASSGCSAARLVFEINDGKISGSGQSGYQNFQISGHVDPDGKAVVNFSIGGDYPLTFSGNSFDMHYTSRGCERVYKGIRGS